jgi:hypothetical protein
MATQILGHLDNIIQDVWGNVCLECDCSDKPNVENYNLKTEEVIVLSCPNCDFTIVVVEVDKCSIPTQGEPSEKDSPLIPTHQQH